MAVELWRYQLSNSSAFEAAVTLSDGHVVVAGWEKSEWDDTEDFKAMKINSTDGNVLWTWKNGTDEDEELNGAAVGSDGYVVLCGYTKGNWSGSNEGDWDLAAVKLNEDGQEVWRLQEGTNGSDYFFAVAVGDDNSAFMTGILDEDFLLMKVDSDGNLVWTWVEDIAGGWDGMFSVVYSAEEDAVVLGGSTAGTAAGVNAGNFSAIKISSDEQEIWRWRDGTVKWDAILSIVPAEDSSLIMVGNTAGPFGVEEAGTQDVVAIKLDVDGTELWRWQNGSSGSERIAAAAMDVNGFVMGGSTDGNWSALNRGERDFIAVKLDAQDGTNETWRWQDGTEEYEQIRAVTSVPDGLMILGGYTEGSFARNNTDGSRQGVVILLRTGYSSDPTVGPVTSPVPTPSSAAADSTGFLFSTLVIVPLIVIFVVVLVLIRCYRRIRACLGSCCS